MAFAYTAVTLSGLNPSTVDTTAAFMTAVKNFMTTSLGWTLTEDRLAQAQQNIVLQSNGEDNTASTFYFVMTSGSSSVGLQAATAWSTSTHTAGSGVASPTASTSVTMNTGSVGSSRILHYWISGDKDSVNLITRLNGVYDAAHFGLIRPLTTAVNDPFPVYMVGDTAASVAAVVTTQSQAFTFLDATTVLVSTEADWEAVFTTPLDSAETPDNIFGATEKFVCLPVIAGVSDNSPVRRSVRGFSKNLWTCIGPATSSLTQEDIFAPGDGKTYQVFFDTSTDTKALVIRRS